MSILVKVNQETLTFYLSCIICNDDTEHRGSKVKNLHVTNIFPEKKACTMYMYQLLAHTKSVQTLKIITG